VWDKILSGNINLPVIQLKRIWYVFIVISALLLGNAVGYVISKASANQISNNVDEDILKEIVVTGIGQASSDPTLASISVGVRSESETALEAVQENAEKMTNIIKFLKNLGISEDRIETQNYRINPIMNYQLKPPKIVGYKVDNTIIVEIHDLSMIGEIIDGSVDFGANEIYGVTFGIEEEKMQELRLEALQKSVDDANKKAETIASTLGVQLLAVLTVSENIFFSHPERLDAGEYKIIETPILPGAFQVTVNVQVSYLIS
jgi:uncharacterized protein YggE